MNSIPHAIKDHVLAFSHVENSQQDRMLKKANDFFVLQSRSLRQNLELHMNFLKR